LQTKLRGGAVDICVQGGGLQLDPVAAAAGDRMSPLGICPRPHQRLWDIEKMAENRPENSKSEANTREIRFSKSFFSSLLARLRGFAHFQGIRTWKINDLGEKVFTTGGGSCSTFEDFRISGFCRDRFPCRCDKTCLC
jgi:hypothetical protein